MLHINEKLAGAKAKYEEARAALEEKRREYENEDGPAKKYVKTKEGIAALKAQIEKYQQAHQAAKQALADALNESNGVATAKTKEALSARRDAEDLIEECNNVLAEVEKNAAALRLPASVAARDYRFAYQTASQCWARLNVYTVLAECGDRICSAMAVVMPDVDRTESGAFDLEVQNNMLLNEIKRGVEAYAGDTKPYVADIGKCDLGGMKTHEILSPVEMQTMRRKLTAA